MPHPQPFALLALAAFAAAPLAPAAESASPPAALSATAVTGKIPVKDTTVWDPGVMGPPTNAVIVAAADAAVAMPMAPGPFQPTWASLEKNYQVPAWFKDAKFGIFMHWGIYSAAAHHNEWYEKHMYGADRQWHAQNFGPQETFGYKDLIPLFTAAKFNADEWVALFKKAGAKFIMPTAQHHDNFPLWDSDLTPINAKKMGPKRDLIGELATAARKQGLRFAVSNHGIENFTFINPPRDLDALLKEKQVDLYDPAWAEFYHVANRSDVLVQKFLTDWVLRNYELIDKYQPDLLWFDNGANGRDLDPLKLKVAAYYYNRALQWGKQVSISTKYVAFAPSNDQFKQIGAIIDFEKVGTRSPPDIRPGPWMVDDAIGSTWGYTTGMSVSTAPAIIAKLVDTVSKDGNFILNISPMADGSIPQNQQDTLLGIGQWLDVNGEAIYGTHAWSKFGEGSGRGISGIRFTVKGDALYAIMLDRPGEQAVITSLATGSKDLPMGKIEKVELLGQSGNLAFTQDTEGLKVKLPATKPADSAYTLKITGLKLNTAAPPATAANAASDSSGVIPQ